VGIKTGSARKTALSPQIRTFLLLLALMPRLMMPPIFDDDAAAAATAASSVSDGHRDQCEAAASRALSFQPRCPHSLRLAFVFWPVCRRRFAHRRLLLLPQSNFNNLNHYLLTSYD